MPETPFISIILVKLLTAAALWKVADSLLSSLYTLPCTSFAPDSFAPEKEERVPSLLFFPKVARRLSTGDLAELAVVLRVGSSSREVGRPAALLGALLPSPL